MALFCLAGCYAPHIPSGVYACGEPGDTCPSGLACVSGYCESGHATMADSGAASQGDGSSEDTKSVDGGSASNDALAHAPSCSNGVIDGSETDVDCGGTCAPCALGKSCSVAADCAANVCASNVCDLDFEPLTIPGNEWITWLDSDGSSTAYATGGTWRVYKSTDSGATWLEVFTPSAEWTGGAREARVLADREGLDVLVYAYSTQSTGTLSNAQIVSHDEFQTAAINSAGTTSWSNVSAFGTPHIVYSLGDKASYVSSNAGDTSTALPSALLAPAGSIHIAAGVNPISASEVMLSYATPGSTVASIALIDTSLQKLTDETQTISTALAGHAPVGLEVTGAQAAGRLLRVISDTGLLATSSDFRTFQAVAGASGGLPSCPTDRQITSLQSTPDVIATWCQGSLWYSKNGGTNWTAAGSAPSWSKQKCSVSSATFSGSELLVGCADGYSFRVAY